MYGPSYGYPPPPYGMTGASMHPMATGYAAGY